MSAPIPKLDSIENFPGWHRAPTFLENEIVRRGLVSVADLGGGANPLLPESFVRAQQLDYTVLDISSQELAKAPAHFNKIQVDVTAPTEEFASKVGGAKFDLVFSHMLLEHVNNPLRAHQNIHSVLRPGGIAIHFFPSPNNLPLALNRLIPESISKRLLRIAQPERDVAGTQGKFPAYYAMCGNPSAELREQFEKMGYEVLQHTGFIGHGYYNRFPVIRDIEVAMRRVLLGSGVALTSAILLILEKR